MRMILYVMTTEFISPCVGETGLRVGRWLSKFGCARWGLCAALLQPEHNVLGAWVRIRPLPCCASCTSVLGKAG